MLRPFTVLEARAAGITRYALRGKSWRRLSNGLYCWVGLGEDPWKLLHGFATLLPGDAMFAAHTSAWLHGLPSEPYPPIEAIVAATCGWRSRAGLTIRHCDASRDVVVVRGLRATSVPRTLVDLCPRLAVVEGLALIDAALFLRLTSKSELSVHRRLRPLVELAEPAQSPMETRLRWLLVESGLPRPQTQVDLCDSDSRFVGRADIFYSAARLVIEYDGVNHRERLIDDDRRQNLMVNAGFKLLRFTAADINQRKDTVVAQVRRALKHS